MITFLPYESFIASANCLDRKRLGKQRPEGKTILDLNLRNDPKKHYFHHPATVMWRGFDIALAVYVLTICDEWISRGYQDTVGDYIRSLNLFPDWLLPQEWWLKTYKPELLPPWLGDQRLHDTHRSRLLSKDPVFYGRYNWNLPMILDYFWPGTPEQYQLIPKSKEDNYV